MLLKRNAAARGAEAARQQTLLTKPPSETHPEASVRIRTHLKSKMYRDVQLKATERLEWKDKARKRSKEEALRKRKERKAHSQMDNATVATCLAREEAVEGSYDYSMGFVREQDGTIAFEVRRRPSS